ncbi:7-dehydrocholesterol reductase [Fulvia fulva]|uniref:7-dehydrocholesterol reductase n=1 Tax=Passalora fulva TaxID=5499 RepID=A0A9Q8P568_PASFU|nr:7-dehydrocholesterol reductase [Fulvia fulva]KAK4631295.1 7-dehydrocholesterol reductase [Fulvia fulva]KAK4632710.1 7-dehydrocholesterol reductase [Fulvia fulva]UJO13604.1 7-dehydrocholesterol reductase [Fulvia fulva]WPV11878.1 7-dehydrocholesterol reductase [Fulvia fulva]WPV25645.1 7-dehydrocholesterol reductase [Fulvia fulva]
MTVEILATLSPELAKPVLWGRNTKAKLENTLGCLGMVIGCPILIVLNWTALEHYNGSLLETFQAAFDQGALPFLLNHLPRPSTPAIAGYAAWLLWQALLYGILPGTTCYGQRTPGGKLMQYTANGLLAWAITHVLYFTASAAGVLDAAIVAKHWEGLLVAVNVYGFFLAALAQLKGYYFPSHPEDRKLSGSWIYDFWAGVELNPRFGTYWDFKFFHNGRPGIVAWTLVDLSWAAYQYQTLGYVTASMWIVLVLQAVYTVDFFWHEDWYTRTIDISHDHFGFMLAWGDTTFLPTFYTLQAQYLARYPTHLTLIQSAAIMALGVTSYIIFRQANSQRDYVRRHNGNAKLWGRPATYIRVKYQTSDNKTHDSLLLTSGWWGVARHANYLADLVQSWAFCATCGFTHFLPWSYFFFMCILLHHRIGRDDRRCRNKYGEKWEEYCKLVPCRLIPGVY